MNHMPNFTIKDYETLLHSFIQAGYQFRTVSEMSEKCLKPTVYIRHDIDFHICALGMMAATEMFNGVKSTWFVPLTLPFNALYPSNRFKLETILDAGHEIGLHYDMAYYPQNIEEAQKQLDWEIEILSKLIGSSVRSIVMHQPFKGNPDPFIRSNKYIHPHNPIYTGDALYVSDSCRAWRDEELMRCFKANPPQKIMLTIHPELWLDGSYDNRIDYLDKVLKPACMKQHEEYFDKIIKDVWACHDAPKLHDKRVKNSNSINKKEC